MYSMSIPWVFHMYIGIIQVLKDILMELNRTMASDLGTCLPFGVHVHEDCAIPDSAFPKDMLDVLRYLRSDLSEFHTVAAAPAMPDAGAGAAGLTYYVNLAMIIGSHR